MTFRIVRKEPSEAMKREAYTAVRCALERGDLVRPSTCSRCGCRPKPAADGRSLIHAHHHNYAKPLDVEWICCLCHRKETPLPSTPGAPCIGSKNGQSKLTEDAVRVIRRMRARGNTIAYIARQFNVDWGTIKHVCTGKHWSHV